MFLAFFAFVQVKVRNSNGTVVSVNRVVGSSAPGQPGDGNTTSDVLTGNFQRQATGGSFELVNDPTGSNNTILLLLINDNSYDHLFFIVINFSARVCIFF